MQVVDVVLLAERLDAAPVRVGRREPLAVARPDVDVDGAEVVVLLMSRRPAVGHLHVKLHGVHPEDHVTDVGEHVGSGHDADEGWKLLQLVELCSPLPLFGEVDVGAESDGGKVGN